MGQDVISKVQQVTPDWLTTTLREMGTLPQGEVVRIIPDAPKKTFASLAWHLRVTYSDDAPFKAPKKLFLKSSSPELAPGEYNPNQMEKE